jgi:phosphoesterase family protein
MKPWALLALAILPAPAAADDRNCQLDAPLQLAAGVYATPRPPQPIRNWRIGRRFERVLIVVLENMDYATVVKHPYFKGLAAQGTLLTRFRGSFHPSYPNYLAMVGGKYFRTVRDEQRNIPKGEPTIADLLEAKGLSWRQYAEGYGGGCNRSDGGPDSRYRRKHVPFLSFDSVALDPARCAKVVPAEEFDPRALPNYALYAPDLCHDGHDSCARGKTPLDQAASWLEGFLAPLLADPDLMESTLIVVTFDESADYSHNHVYTALLGGMVRPGAEISDCLDHFNMLRTIEDNFGLGTLDGEDAGSAPIIGAFGGAVSSPPSHDDPVHR